MIKKLFLIDPNVKGSMSETFDKSQMSETIDVPAGWLIIKLWNDNLLHCIYGTSLLWFNYCAIYNMLILRIVYLISQFLACCHVYASQRGGTDNCIQLQCIDCERGYWSFIEFIFWLIWGQFRVTIDLHLWWTWLLVQNVIPWP